VRVRPGARDDCIVGVHAGALKVRVSRPPEKGRANEAVIDLVAGALGVPPASVLLRAGRSSRDKVLVVALPAATVRERLEKTMRED
jgi:uncharacterized protein YggU (UPF0235/DUF167 family)